MQFKRGLFAKLNFSHLIKYLPAFIICFGIILRLRQYLANPSLWSDEAALALNIINRSFLGLLQPLQPFQVAPAGFLMVERLMVQVFGNSEYALRLFPFLCGVVSLFLFYKVTKHYINEKAALIALGLFAVSDRLIYYSSEVKQYSSDVAITLLLLLLTIYIQSKRLSASRIVLFAFTGAIAIWFSHPAVFVLAGVGSVLILSCLVKREWSRVGCLLVVYSVWILSFTACYFVSIGSLSHKEHLLSYWRGGFMPFSLTTFSDARWFVRRFFGIFEPIGLPLRGIAALTFLIGCISMFLKKKKEFFILISPMLFAFLAAAFHKYPFKGRLLLFIVPMLLLFIAEGAELVRVRTRHNLRILGALLICLLFFHPVFWASYHLIKPPPKEEIRPVINHVKEHEKNGDVLYIYHGGLYPFKYYSGSYGFNAGDYTEGKDAEDGNWRTYTDDLDKFLGNKRVWVLFSHVLSRKGVDERQFFLYYLDSKGERIDSFESPGAAVYLYDLSEEASKARR